MCDRFYPAPLAQLRGLDPEMIDLIINLRDFIADRNNVLLQRDDIDLTADKYDKHQRAHNDRKKQLEIFIIRHS